MSMLSVIRVHQRLAQTIEDEIAQFQVVCTEQRNGGGHDADPNEADELIRLEMASARQLGPLWQRLWQSFQEGADCDYETVGQPLERTFAAALQTLGKAKASSAWFRQQGAPLAVEDELDRVIEETEKLRAKVFGVWPRATDPAPVIDPGIIDSGMEAYRRGDWQDLGDAIRELQGPHPARGQ